MTIITMLHDGRRIYSRVKDRLSSALAAVITLISITILLVNTMPAQQVFAITQDDLNSIATNTPFYDPNATRCSESSTTSTAGTAASTPLSNVYILGDSITERSQQQYITSFQQKGVTANVDASSSRSLNGPGTDGNMLTGMQAITQDKTQITQAQAIVVALGTNGGNTAQSIDQAITAIRADAPTTPIYWVDTIVVDRPTYAPVIQAANQAIYGQAASENYTVVSWFKTVDSNGNPQQLTGAETDTNGYIDNSDGLGVHPTPAGITALTGLVVGAVTGGAASPTSGSTASCACQAGGGTTATATTSGGGNGTTPDANVKTAFDFFLGNGYSAVQAAGIVGNLMYESGGGDTDINPTEEEAGGGGGYGIAQFTPPTAMRAWVTAKGEDPASLQGQLDYLLYDLNTNETAAKAAILATNTVDDATSAFEVKFERPANDAASISNRETAANDAYTSFSGDTGTAPTTTTGSGCATSTTTSASCSQGNAVTGDAKILCEAEQYSGIYYEYGGGHEPYNPTFKAACPDPTNPPDNQPHGGPAGVSGNPSPCATDCSGLVSVAMSEAFGQNFEQSVSSGGVMEGTDAGAWQKISIAQAQPGDVVTLADSTGHVEIVDSVSGTSITTFGSHATGTQTGTNTLPTSYWYAAYHWTGTGSS